MDQTLIDLLKEATGASDVIDADIRIINGRSGEIEFGRTSRLTKYTLKPLNELYGPGRGFPSADPLNTEYGSLFYTIERSILTYYESVDDLTDEIVRLTLDRMGVNPACDPRNDELCRCLQFDLRLFLSVVNYSKKEVRQAFRTISRSVQRHAQSTDSTHYLDFISRQFED